MFEVEIWTECFHIAHEYSNLNTTSSDTKELLALPGKVWNFDPKVLEGTVEMIGMFKDAYKMVEEIKEWKVASNPEIENFPFDDHLGSVFFDEHWFTIEAVSNSQCYYQDVCMTEKEYIGGIFKHHLLLWTKSHFGREHLIHQYDEASAYTHKRTQQ
ncbi:hypothetical protein B9Z55_004425 [Caenorhabditis nigoni]|uniref:Uncharacterized protein n=1 Tax=Caenorhabditis nigoni TaxID=1611254 RepID=A0A2G5UWH1_9PELO|nr:hypothetical protein B9Z55_004425 [Caenorhabditis nigoni]